MALEYQLNVPVERFLDLAKAAFGQSGKVTLRIQGWQDGDHYSELCSENGGANPVRQQLFQSLPLHFSSKQWAEVESKALPFLIHPHLGTDSGAYKFPFDIYISGSNKVIVYNPMLGSIRSYKPALMESLFGLATPAWQNDVQQNP